MHRLRTFWLVVFLLLVSHVLLPISFIMQLWNFRGHDILVWILLAYTACGFVAFLVLAGAWSWFGRIARYALPFFATLAAFRSFPAVDGQSLTPGSVDVNAIISFCVGTTFLVFALLALVGRRMPVPAIDLRFPFRDGTFIVGQGGCTRIINHHCVSPSQRYGLDILKLNSAGVRARGLYPSDLTRYEIWDAEVTSPCDGVVAAVVDGLPDLVPPERDPLNRAGNYVALACNGVTVYLCHLMKGSIRVKSGDRVLAGQLLGQVGNSGNTTEPHLHIHAEEGTFSGQFSGKPGIPIRFDGRFLVRNDRMNVSP